MRAGDPWANDDDSGRGGWSCPLTLAAITAVVVLALRLLVRGGRRG